MGARPDENDGNLNIVFATAGMGLAAARLIARTPDTEIEDTFET